MRRLIIPHDSLNDVSEALVEELSKVKIGNPKNTETQMGALVSEGQKQEVLKIISKMSNENTLILTE